MKAFVTGATGLLGSNLVKTLRAGGHEVAGLVRSVEKAERLLTGTGARIIVGDMRAADAFADSLRAADVVFHTAAYFREYYAPGDHAAALEEINIGATLKLLAIADAAGVSSFVHTSSSGTRGRAVHGRPGDEDTPPTREQLANLYLRSKIEGDARIRAFAPSGIMRVIEILPGWMWGPGDVGPGATGQLARDFLARKLPVIPPGGADVVDARDVAAAMIVAAERAAHGDRYIVAGRAMALGEVLAVLEQVSGVRGPRLQVPYAAAYAYAAVAEAVARLMGKSSLVTRRAVHTMVNNTHVSSARAERELGARFRPFEETARDVVAWSRAQASNVTPAGSLPRAAA